MLSTIERDKQLQILEEAFKQAYNSIVITTPNVENPEFIYVNPAFSRITGYSLDEVVGKNPKILQGRDTDRAVIERLKISLKNGEFFQGSTINYRKNGNAYWVEWNITPIKDKNGEIIYFLSIQQDISQRKKLEQELIASKLKFQTLFQKLIKKIKLDIDSLDYYQKFKHIFEEKIEESQGVKVCDFISKEDLEEVLKIHNNLELLVNEIYSVRVDDITFNKLVENFESIFYIFTQYEELEPINKTLERFISILHKEKESFFNTNSGIITLIDALIQNLHKLIRLLFIDGFDNFEILSSRFKLDIDAIETYITQLDS